MQRVKYEDLGLIEYQQAWDYQEKLLQHNVALKSAARKINPDYLYSFIPIPETINMMFLGFVDMAEKSLVLALLVGITTYFQTSIASSGQNQVSDGSKQGELAKAMAFQMKYFLIQQ